MKKILSMLLVSVFVITSAVTLSSCNTANPASDFEYSISDDGKYAGIEKYIGNDKSVVIPEEIDGKKVTEISPCAFENQSITSVVIPDTVGFIERNAFSGCTELKKVVMGKNVGYIYKNAFENCSSLEEIDLPDELEVLDEKAFYGCDSLKSISIPPKSRLIEQCFCENEALKTIKFEEGRENITGYAAFLNLPSLEEIIIPSTAEKIPDIICYYCPKLTKVTFLGDAPTELGKTVFGPENKDLKIYYKKGTKGWDTTDLAKWYTLVEY